MHGGGGVTGHLIVCSGFLRIARRPPVVSQCFDRTPLGRLAFQREGNLAMARPHLDGEKFAVDRLARKSVAKAERARRLLLDDLKVAGTIERRQHVLHAASQRGGKQIELKGPSDRRRLRDDPAFVFGKRPQPLEQYCPHAMWKHAFVRVDPPSLALDGTLEQLFGEKRVAFTRANDRSLERYGQVDR